MLEKPKSQLWLEAIAGNLRTAPLAAHQKDLLASAHGSTTQKLCPRNHRKACLSHPESEHLSFSSDCEPGKGTRNKVSQAKRRWHILVAVCLCVCIFPRPFKGSLHPADLPVRLGYFRLLPLFFAPMTAAQKTVKSAPIHVNCGNSSRGTNSNSLETRVHQTWIERCHA